MASLPLATSFRWSFNNSYENDANNNGNGISTSINRSRFQANGTHSMLAYLADSEKDFGELRCWAQNEVGETDKPCVFTLMAAGKKIIQTCLEVRFVLS